MCELAVPGALKTPALEMTWSTANLSKTAGTHIDTANVLTLSVFNSLTCCQESAHSSFKKETAPTAEKTKH